MTLQEKLDAIQKRADKADKTHMAHNYHAAVITVPRLVKALLECRKQRDAFIGSGDSYAKSERDNDLLAILEGEDE